MAAIFLLKIRLLCNALLTAYIHSRDGNRGKERFNIWSLERKYDGWTQEDNVRIFRIFLKVSSWVPLMLWKQYCQLLTDNTFCLSFMVILRWDQSSEAFPNQLLTWTITQFKESHRELKDTEGTGSMVDTDCVGRSQGNRCHRKRDKNSMPGTVTWGVVQGDIIITAIYQHLHWW